MAWDEYHGSVTRAFDGWKTTDADIRAYLVLSRRWIDKAYRETWDEAQREFAGRFDPDRDDPDDYVDVFHDKVSGLWAKDYFWMLRSSVLRDAVTAFEVYAEKSLNELLSWFRFDVPDGDTYRLVPVVNPSQLSPSWTTLREVHTALGNDLETEPIKYVRALRHLLTHQRGELRTEEQRNQYASEANADDWLIGDAYVGGDVPLAHDRVIEMMDQIAAVVRASDPAVWRHTWGRAGFPEALRGLASGRRAVLQWRVAETRPR